MAGIAHLTPLSLAFWHVGGGGGYGQGMGNVSKCSLGLCIFNLRKRIVGFWGLVYSWRRF